MSDKQLMKLMHEMEKSNERSKDRVTKEEAELIRYLILKGFQSPNTRMPTKE